MESNLVRGPAESFTTSYGAEIVYCERGNKNGRPVILPGFFLITFMDIIDALSDDFHVYGMVMRMDGPGNCLEADGSVNWAHQWGADEYELARHLELEKFAHFGKCHGSIPGWWMAKNHPEMLEGLASYFLAPHVKPQNANKFIDLMIEADRAWAMAEQIRRPETGLPKKMEEVGAIGAGGDDPVQTQKVVGTIAKYGGYPEMAWDTQEECAEFLRNISIPVDYLFGTEDPLFHDWYDNNIWVIGNTRGAHAAILQGECHLMEIDCPERVANEFKAFMAEVDCGCAREVMAHPFDREHEQLNHEHEAFLAEKARNDEAQAANERATIAKDAPDPDLAGTYVAEIDLPIGRQRAVFSFNVDGTALSGTVEMMGKQQPIEGGQASMAGFSGSITIKAPVFKMKGQMSGKREGDAIKGIMKTKMGEIAFEADRQQ
ncbi:MAG: alpha/beta hydrolase [Eggerthellaceae bacterium]|nr:alpha/beta hydrolase [Eggerthellaceae bacterium]